MRIRSDDERIAIALFLDLIAGQSNCFRPYGVFLRDNMRLNPEALLNQFVRDPFRHKDTIGFGRQISRRKRKYDRQSPLQRLPHERSHGIEGRICSHPDDPFLHRNCLIKPVRHRDDHRLAESINHKRMFAIGRDSAAYCRTSNQSFASDRRLSPDSNNIDGFRFQCEWFHAAVDSCSSAAKLVF